ncbi:hypothetical protein MSAN_00448800 [Mycena sanguinolenta]|uniref:Transmembrane protein n=1 Tax=Mycena sanguinolenta TaxID=230812 RepID=A0A8H6ZDD4_9AGAR|nr:hypothetical protein MSAN_00448800 [Mycena sanguinolenta]
MPSFVRNIDITSPLIQYAGPWVVGGKDGDPDTVKYNKQTFTFCPSTPCSATMTFNGTEVHIFGAWRTNSGSFQVVLDSQTLGPFPPATTVDFQVDKFNQTGLSPGLHTLTVANGIPNGSRTDLDLDFFTWTTDISSLIDFQIQDTFFSYEGSWGTDLAASNLFDFDGGTGHFTTESGATANLTFKGDRIALFGAIGSQFGSYSVQVDGGPASNFSAAGALLNSTYLAGQMLFYADHLSGDDHTITVAAATSGGQLFSLDYAIVDGTVNTAATTVTSGAPTETLASTRPSRPLSPGALGGIIAASCTVVMCIVCALLFLFYRRRRVSSRTQELYISTNFVSTGATSASGTPTATSTITPYWMTEPQPPQYESSPNSPISAAGRLPQKQISLQN